MTEIAGYTDLEIIGRGGFAIVYKARQVSVGRDVAIKLLIDPSPDDDLVRRFQRESKAVGALSWHPHIAAVVDAGTTDQGLAYIVFELLSGGSLDDRIKHAPMPWADAVASMIQVADAVEAAHREDVLHRDIKPANILLDRLGVAKLGDFGIASMQDGNKTETGMLATTVAHAAPELFDGQLSSAATDVYALGSTLHNLVAGTPPFTPMPSERIVTTINKIMHEPPPRLDPSVAPEPLSLVISHALAKQPQYRLRSAAAFGRALQDVQRQVGRPVTAMPVTDAEPAPTPSQIPAAQAVPPVVQQIAQEVPGASPAAHSSPMPHESAVTNHVPMPINGASTASTAAASKKPFSRTIGLLSAVAVLLAGGVAGLVAFQARSGTSPLLITEGGARVLKFEALSATEMPAPFGAVAALDRNRDTAWGITPDPDANVGIAGTSYVINLSEEQRVVRVGISNGSSAELDRVSGLIWGTRLIDDRVAGSLVVTQDIADAAGDQPLIDFDVTTSQIVLAIADLHDPNATQVGIAEILIEVQE